MLTNLTRILFRHEDGTGAGAPAAEDVAGAPAAEAAAIPEPQPGPWSADLEAFFEDPQVRAQADQFLREKVQPRVTKFEQESSQYAPARELYDDLLSDTDGTLNAIVTQIYGDDVAAAVAQAIQGGASQEDVAEALTPEQGALPPEVKALLDDVKPLVERDKEEQARNAYRQELDRVKEEFPGLVEDEFHPFVVTAEGDMGAALEGYKRWLTGIEARYGPRPVEEAAPPAALGTEGAAAVSPSVAVKYGSLAEALDATLDEMRAARAPTPVGAV